MRASNGRPAAGDSGGWRESREHSSPRREDVMRSCADSLKSERHSESVTDWRAGGRKQSDCLGCDGRLTGNLFESPASLPSLFFGLGFDSYAHPRSHAPFAALKLLVFLPTLQVLTALLKPHCSILLHAMVSGLRSSQSSGRSSSWSDEKTPRVRPLECAPSLHFLHQTHMA
jgi:hypothetical protein